MTDENYLKKLADMQTQIKELVPDSLKENGERRMTKDEAIKVLKMVEAHGLADKAKSVAIEALETEAITVEWIRKYIEEYPYMTASSMLHYWSLDQALERKAIERKKGKKNE